MEGTINISDDVSKRELSLPNNFYRIRRDTTLYTLSLPDFLDDVKHHRMKHSALRRCLRHCLHAAIFSFIDPYEILSFVALLNSSNAIITGFVALAIVHPQVLRQLCPVCSTSSGRDELPHYHRLIPAMFPQSLIDSPLTSQCHDRSAPRFETLPICIPFGCHHAVLNFLVHSDYHVLPDLPPELYQTTMQDGHLLVLPFHQRLILKHDDRNTFILLLVSPHTTALEPIFHSPSSTDFVFVNDKCVYVANTYTFQNKAIVRDDISTPQRRQIREYGFDVQDSFSAWECHDCFQSLDCPHRLQSVSDGIGVYYSLNKSATPEQVFHDLSRYMASLIFLTRFCSFFMTANLLISLYGFLAGQTALIHLERLRRNTKYK